MNDKDFESVNKKQERNRNFNFSSSFFRRNRNVTLAGIGTVFLIGGAVYLHQQGFFKGNKVNINPEGFSYEPDHTAKIKTGDNDSKTGDVGNFSVGTNPSLETGKNTAEKNINNVAIDKDTPQSVTDFLAGRRNK